MVDLERMRHCLNFAQLAFWVSELAKNKAKGAEKEAFIWGL